MFIQLKPRTNGDGYKGLIHQPDAEGDVDLLAGVKAVRHLQSRIITETGLPIADEMLYPSNLSFFDDPTQLPRCWSTFG